jgi:hypothetical protein
MSANQTDACLRILRLRTQKKNGPEDDALLSSLRDAFELFRGDPVEAFLFLRLKENYRQQKQQVSGSPAPPCTHVYRDFVRLYQQLRVVPTSEEEEEGRESQGGEKGDGGGGAKAPAAREPHSLLVAARNVIDRLAHLDDSAIAPEGLCKFVIGSLGRLVSETTSAVASIKDWDRLWDVVNPKFVRSLPTSADHETAGRSSREGAAAVAAAAAAAADKYDDPYGGERVGDLPLPPGGAAGVEAVLRRIALHAAGAEAAAAKATTANGFPNVNDRSRRRKRCHHHQQPKCQLAGR